MTFGLSQITQNSVERMDSDDTLARSETVVNDHNILETILADKKDLNYNAQNNHQIQFDKSDFILEEENIKLNISD
jgi:hypothetical protein